MPPSELNDLVDAELSDLEKLPVTSDTLFRRIMLSHVRAADARHKEHSKTLGEAVADIRLLKDKVSLLETSRVKDLETKVSKLENDMIKVYAYASAFAFLTSWAIPKIFQLMAK